MDMFGKNSWEDRDTHEKRQAVSSYPGTWKQWKRSSRRGKKREKRRFAAVIFSSPLDSRKLSLSFSKKP